MTVRHRNGQYEVRFCDPSAFLADLPSNSYLITDASVADVFAASIPPSIPKFCFLPGERSKSLETFGKALEWLAANGADRESTVVAFGGGVVGDLAGYVAASYMRGIRYVQVPTTLLAQVDSSVGGKVGVDLHCGKNLAGAFHPPHEVRVAVGALRSLPDREFANGMAEVWKYGFIRDVDLTRDLEGTPLSKNGPTLEATVRRCIEHKVAIVERDEFETTGERAILNFGHTIGHAIERLSGFGTVLHGEAISVGMVVESRLGEALGITEPGTADRIAHCLSESGLPVASDWTREADALIEAVRRDKKSIGGSLAFSLVTSIGACKLFPSLPEADVREALKRL